MPISVNRPAQTVSRGWPLTKPSAQAFLSRPAGSRSYSALLPAVSFACAAGNRSRARWRTDGAAGTPPAAGDAAGPTPAGGVAVQVGTFAVLPGGHPDGSPLSMTALQTPDSNRLLWQTAGGQIVTGLNPRVA